MNGEAELGLGSKEIGDPEPIDYKKVLEGNRVLFMNDSHTSFADKAAFKKALEELSKLGVTDLALEMLPRGFDTSDSGEVREYFKNNWSKRPGMEDQYFEIYQLARSLGMNIHGLDIPAEEYRATDIRSTFGKRNRQWAEVVKDIIVSNPSSKLVVFCGSSHSGYYPARDRANNILEGLGFPSRSASFFGGDNNFTLTDEDRLVQVIAKAGNERSGFMVEFKSPRRPADYIIHSTNPTAV